MMTSRRFSDDQIKSLETTFQAEARPELRLKQHLAHKLGLQPRQVAIWFQNKRARSKSKEVEKEYAMLKSSYDHLVSELDALRKENQALLIQLQTLRMVAAGVGDGEGRNNNKNQVKLADMGRQRFLASDLNRRDDYLAAAAEVMDMELIAEGSLPENGSSFRSCTFPDCDDSGGRSQWWDF